MKKWLVLTAIVLTVTLSIKELVSPSGSLPVEEKSGEATKVVTGKGWGKKQSDDTNQRVGASIPKLSGSTPLEVAQSYLDRYKNDLQIQEHHHLKPVAFAHPLGTTVRYAVYQGALPIIGLSLKIKIDSDLNVEAVENDYIPLEKAELDTNRTLQPALILRRSADRFSYDENSLQSTSKILYVSPFSSRPELAYVMQLRDRARNNQPVQVVFRAKDGEILAKSAARSEF